LLAVVLAGKFLGEGAPLLERLAKLVQGLGVDVGVSEIEKGGVPARLTLIKHAIEVFKKYPIMGAGWGTFRVYSFAVYTHTTPFELLYATGIVGTLLYYYIVVSAIRTLMKGRTVVRDYFGENRGIEICLALVAAQLAAGLAIPIINNKVFATVPGIWLGITWYIRTLSREQGEKHLSFGGPASQ
jgi:O-antigen ligase